MKIAAVWRARHPHRTTRAGAPPELDIAHIRFPNTEGRPLAGCEAGTIIYVFTPGEITVCPYLVFAARTPASTPSSARSSTRRTPRDDGCCR